MAATLYLSSDAKVEVVRALKEDLTHVFVGRDVNITVGTQLSQGDLQSLTSDNSFRVKQPRINEITTEYRTENNLAISDESRITNFYILGGIAVNKLVLMNSTDVVNGIITFPTINPDATKSLYVPEIKINVL